MSQYPSPYQPPANVPYYGMPMGMPDLLAPAKRASVLMFVLGGLGLLMGGCFAAFPTILKAAPGPQGDQLRQQMAQTLQQVPVEVAFPILGGLMIVGALAMIVLALFVRRGGRGAALTGCIFVGLICAYWLLNVAASFLQPPGSQMVAGLCFSVIFLAMFGLLFWWLIAAFKAAANLNLARQHYAAQYWQYQQNMQAYGYAQQQQQLGYPTTPTLPAPPQNPTQNPPQNPTQNPIEPV